MPKKSRPTRRYTKNIRVTEQDIKEYISLRDQRNSIDKAMEEKKKKFNAYAESVGFEEDTKVIIERGEHAITVTEISKLGVTEEVEDLITGTDPRFKRYAKCMETFTVTELNQDLLMNQIEKDLLRGRITEEDANELIKTTSSTRITVGK